MDTHRYIRKPLSESVADRYDLNLRISANAHQSNVRVTEYWTNGTTTLLSVPSSTRAAALQYPSPTSAMTLSSFSSESVSESHHSHRQDQNVSTTKPNEPSTSTVVRNSLLAGSAGGITSTLVCHPCDVLRVQIQTAALSSATKLGVVGTARQTIQHGGLRALYTGLAVPLAAQAVYKGTVFTVNNVTQQAIVEWRTQENYKLGNFTPYQVTMFDRFWCGFMGGAINGALFASPVEFIRNQQINQATSLDEGRSKSSAVRRSMLGPLAVVRNTIKSDGVLGLWRGTTSTVIRDSFGCGCFFVAMAYSQKYLSSQNVGVGGEGVTPSHAVLVTSGALAGVSFWLVALPLDTMKTWIQNGNARNLRHALELSQKNGFWPSLSTLNQGWQVAYGRGAPSAAIAVTTYALVYDFLAKNS